MARAASRLLLRAPIALYRARLGLVLGHRFLLLEHTGRTSGLPRHAVLEVIGRPEPGVYLVVSGPQSHWVRNVRATRRVRISVGSMHAIPATARILDQDEARRELAAYVINNRLLARGLFSVLAGRRGDPLASLDELARALPVVELRPSAPHRGRT